MSADAPRAEGGSLHGRTLSASLTVKDRYEPDPATRGAYEGAYGRYLDLFDALRPLFATGGRPR